MNTQQLHRHNRLILTGVQEGVHGSKCWPKIWHAIVSMHSLSWAACMQVRGGFTCSRQQHRDWNDRSDHPSEGTLKLYLWVNKSLYSKINLTKKKKKHTTIAGHRWTVFCIQPSYKKVFLHPHKHGRYSPIWALYSESRTQCWAKIVNRSWLNRLRSNNRLLSNRVSCTLIEFGPC